MQGEDEAQPIQVEEKGEEFAGGTCAAEAYHEAPGLHLQVQHPEVTSARAACAAGKYPATVQSLMEVDGETSSSGSSDASHYASAGVAEENSKDVLRLSEEVSDNDET